MKDQMLKLNPKSNAKMSILLDHTQIKVFRERLNEYDIVSNKKNPKFKNEKKSGNRASWNYNATNVNFNNTINNNKAIVDTVSNFNQASTLSNTLNKIKVKVKPLLETKKTFNKELSKIALISSGYQNKNTIARQNSRNSDAGFKLKSSQSVRKDELSFLKLQDSNTPSSNNYRFKRNVESILPRRFNTSVDSNKEIDIITNKVINKEISVKKEEKNTNNNPFNKNTQNTDNNTIYKEANTGKDKEYKYSVEEIKVKTNNKLPNKVNEEKMKRTDEKNVRAVKRKISENSNLNSEKNSKSFFFFNDTIKNSQEKNKVEKLIDREAYSNKVYEKIDKITKFSEKERLISKIQAQPNNILVCKADFMKIKADKTSKDLEKRQEKVIDMGLKLNNKLEKEKYYTMNERVIKTLEQTKSEDSKPKILFIGSLKKCANPILSSKI